MSKSKKEEKRRRESLGGALCDFVNAETAQNSAFGLFDNVEKALNHYSSFAIRAKDAFSPISNLFSSSLVVSSEPASRFYELVAREDDIWESIWQLRLSEKYGEPRWRKNDTISFISRREREDHGVVFETIDIKIETDDIETILDQNLNPKQSEVIRKLVDARKEIVKFKKDFPAAILDSELIRINNMFPTGLQGAYTYYEFYDSTDKFNKLCACYERILSIERQINRLKRDLSDVLKAVIEGGRLTGYYFFERAVIEYNSAAEGEAIIFESDELQRGSTFNEKDLLDINDAIKSLKIGDNYSYILRILAYFLIEFLMPERNRKYMGKCPYCHHFFIKEQTNRVKCYSDDCERTYQAMKKKKQRDKDPVKYL